MFPMVATTPQMPFHAVKDNGGQNKHYFGDKIQLRHIFHTAKLAGLSKQTVEDILQEIVVASSRLNSIPTQDLPEQIIEPILSGVERKLAKVNR